MLIRKIAMMTGFAAVALAGHLPAFAQWPNKPITLIVPYTPGGNADTLARLIAQPLSERLGKPVIVENRPGAGGMIGSQYAARAKPDGYTFLLGSVANILYKHFYQDVPIDFETALQPVSQLVSVPNFIAVSPTSELNNIQDVIRYAKSNTLEISCGNPGIGTTPYLTCEMLKTQLGIDITSVPYQGSTPALTDVIGGQITLVVASEALPYIKDNRLKPIAVSSKSPTPLAPDIPSLSTEIEGLDVVSWFGIFAPQGTPQEIIDQVSSEIVASLKSEEIRSNLTTLGAIPVGSTSTEFDSYYKAEAARWRQEIKAMDMALQ